MSFLLNNPSELNLTWYNLFYVLDFLFKYWVSSFSTLSNSIAWLHARSVCSMCTRCVRTAFCFIHHFNSYEIRTGKVHHLLLVFFGPRNTFDRVVSAKMHLKICAAMVYSNILIIIHLTICAKFEQEHHNNNVVSPKMHALFNSLNFFFFIGLGFLKGSLNLISIK